MGIVFSFSVLARGALLVLVSVLPARLTLNSGETVEGQLVAIKDAAIVFQSEAGSMELPFDDVLSLASTNSQESTGPTSRVALADGSRIAAQDYSLQNEILTIEPRRQEPLKVPVKLVKSIRFRVASPLTDPQWFGLLEKPARRDLLVIRREGDRLDPTEGIVEAIGDGKVSFNLDGETVEAPTERLEGLVFGGAALDPKSSSIHVTDRYGSHWLARSIATSEDAASLSMELGESLSHLIPLSQLESIRWSGGLTLLASQKPASSSYAPYIETAIDNNLLQDWFAPTSSGDSDILMIGDSHIEYRLEEGYQTFAGSVRRDEGVERAGELTVRVSLDDTAAWSEKLVGAETLGFELAVQDAKRLRIEVDSGEDGDIGDRVIVVRPRLLK